MKNRIILLLGLAILSARVLRAQDKPDTSSHIVQFVAVEKDVKLEVLDWGGSGPPMVFLAGLGDTAHIFDRFAPKFTANHHVYGITRRGFGLSSAPVPTDDNYSADRLGDDVLAVIAALKIDRPILVGHSIAGEELSSVGSRHPEKVAGLIYLDAGYGYALYDSVNGSISVDYSEMRRKLSSFLTSPGPRGQKAAVKDLLQSTLPQLERDLKLREADLAKMPDLPMTASESTKPSQTPAVAMAIVTEEEKYTEIKVPVLAIFALPHVLGPDLNNDIAAHAAAEANDLKLTTAQLKAFEARIPTARVVRLPYADHYVFNSNEAEVLREMTAFISTLL